MVDKEGYFVKKVNIAGERDYGYDTEEECPHIWSRGGNDQKNQGGRYYGRQLFCVDH